MVGKDTQKDVRLDPILKVVENGTLPQRALHGSEGRLEPRQQNVGAPDFIGRRSRPTSLLIFSSFFNCPFSTRPFSPSRSWISRSSCFTRIARSFSSRPSLRQ